jgi:hypothetical protein
MNVILLEGVHSTSLVSLNELQTGAIDTVAPNAVTFNHLDDNMLFTTPYRYDEEYMLMLRSSTALDLNMDSLTARIEWLVYVLGFILLSNLCAISWLNERRHSVQDDDNKINTYWNIIQSMMPLNTIEWVHQSGRTRRVVSLTLGYALLMMTTYYQSNLLYQLMLPPVPRSITFVDIANRVNAFNAKIIFRSNTTIAENEIRRLNSYDMKLLADAMKKNKPIYEPLFVKQLDAIQHHNGILLDTLENIYFIMYYMKDDDCAKYMMIPLRTRTNTFRSIILHHSRRDMLELINVHIAGRFEFVHNMTHRLRPTDVCLNHLQQIQPPVIIYTHLQLSSLSGVFILLAALLFICINVLFVEIGVAKTHVCHTEQQADKRCDSIVFDLNRYTPEDHVFIKEKYVEFLRTIDAISQ